MTKSRIKQAIDETIGNEPLLTDEFIEKVLTKKKPRKSLQWVQPAIALCMLLMLGFTLYFLPNEQEQTASSVEVKASLISEAQRKTVERYFDAINKKDATALQKVVNVDAEKLLEEYRIFDLEQQPLEVIKTVDEKERIFLYFKLSASDQTFLNEIQYVKATGKIEVSTQQLFYTSDDIEFPRSIDLEFRPAGFAIEMQNFDVNAEEQAYEKRTFIDGEVLHQLKNEEGTLRVLETRDGKFYDLGIFSDGPSTLFNGHPFEYFVQDEETSIVTLLFKLPDGQYQLINGDLQRDRGLTSYKKDFHDEPFYFFGGREAKIVTVQNGELVSAEIFEHTKLEGPSRFYSVDVTGPIVLLKYNEDYSQRSDYYTMGGFDKLSVERVDYDAKESHLRDKVFINRDNYYNQYVFYGDQLKVTFNPKDVQKDGETEKIYTNIKVQVDGKKYFITGDGGFSLQLTRTDWITLTDEEGNEFRTDSRLD